MPETVTLQLEEMSEEALKERINLRKVTAAVDMYDQLLQAGTAVSVETTHDLLDLICLYSDRDPVQDGQPQTEDMDGSGADHKKRKWRVRRASDLLKVTWKENNNAERIFNLLPEKDTRCYSALIRGMVMHGAYAKAFSVYTDMLNNRLTGELQKTIVLKLDIVRLLCQFGCSLTDVHIFNALISAAPDVREKYNERWDVIAVSLLTVYLNTHQIRRLWGSIYIERKSSIVIVVVVVVAERSVCVPLSAPQELLNQMSQQKVQPNLLTFNSVLKALRRCGALGRTQARQTLNEMKALGIGSVGKSNVDILQEVMSELAGASFTCQDPDDALFFSSAMRICLDHKDLHLSYKVQSLVEVGENWRLLGDSYQQSIYYGRFFNLLCMMEHIDVVLKWYRRLIPSLYYPNSQGLRDLLQALDTDSRLDLLPTIWKDIRTLGHDNKADLVEEVLNLMARETHSPEVSETAITVRPPRYVSGLEGHAAALQSKEQSSYRGAVRGLPVRVSQQRLSPESSGASPAFRCLLSLRNTEAGNASAGRVCAERGTKSCVI
ncbi:Pentatricopeptide repeat domain-containing protein 3, mitochondrial [Collichthys lucidus]|uniref:Small ribosomal subunit protein mS39 n=1 Tax=Collichthys lucidus TaxID=240159 RepID=A0A4U5UDV5_COLLU|nr:Pentatricopeptide repeat domain-containing protein 3, mitochondrial [Collichthys lucidus]